MIGRGSDGRPRPRASATEESRMVSQRSHVVRFRLRSPITGIEGLFSGRMKTVRIPAGETITVHDEPVERSWVLSGEWNGRRIAIFADDIESSGELVARRWVESDPNTE